MSQVNLHNDLNVLPAAEQQAQVPQNPGPRNDLPPEMQNARPSGRSVAARVGAFLFGAGAAGGTAAAFGGGALLSGVLGTGATAALGGAAVVAGIATGGAALIGGALGLGLFMGIRSIVRHFRRAPDPAPRLQDMPANDLPGAHPAADSFNNNVARFFTGKGVLPVSLQQAAGNAVDRMRNVYGEDLVPQGADLKKLLDSQENWLAAEIRGLEDNVSAEKFGELVEKYLRIALAYEALQNAFRPLCGQEEYARISMEMRNNAISKYPGLFDELKNAHSPEQVRHILEGKTDEFRTMVQLNDRVEKLKEKTKSQMISIIAQGLGLDPDVAAPMVNTSECEKKMQKLKFKIVRGEVDAALADQEFARLAADLAKQYVDAFAAVDAAQGLSDETKAAMKKDILTYPKAPSSELFSKGIAAGQSIDASALKTALDAGVPRHDLFALITGFGRQVNDALRAQYGDEAWNALLLGDPGDLRTTQTTAFLAMIDRVPGLREALGQLPNDHFDEDLNGILLGANADDDMKGAAMAGMTGYRRIFEVPLLNDDLAEMQAQTQTLNTIKSSGIRPELKARWCEKAMNGSITGPAMARALIENVPGLSAEAQPIVERFILMQSYAPDKAAASAGKARSFAREAAEWQNFSTRNDQNMAPVDALIRENITGEIFNSQTYDRGISSQMKLDVHRNTYTVNGEVFSHSDADEVARSLRRAMPTEEATKLVSSIVNQRSFVPLNALGMQLAPTGDPLPPNVLDSMKKMATRNIATGGLLHIDLGSRDQGEGHYKVTVRNGRAFIEISEMVGLDSGLGKDEQGYARLCGKVRYTLRFECDLLGHDGHSPSIESVHLDQELVPVE